MQTQCKAELAMSGLPGRWLHSRAGYIAMERWFRCFFLFVCLFFFCKNSIAHSTGPVYIPV